MQKVTLIGNLGKDAEKRFTSSGQGLLSFSIAVTPKKNETVWYDIVIWNDRIPLFERIIPYLTKGSRVCIMGDLNVPQVYQAKDGTWKAKLSVSPFSINFIPSGAPRAQEGATPSALPPIEERGATQGTAPEREYDENLPF